MWCKKGPLTLSWIAQYSKNPIDISDERHTNGKQADNEYYAQAIISKDHMLHAERMPDDIFLARCVHMTKPNILEGQRSGLKDIVTFRRMLRGDGVTTGYATFKDGYGCQEGAQIFETGDEIKKGYIKNMKF